MSVDISRLSAHLSDAQRIAIQAEYERQAKSPTAAFLLCFFLGIFGAHRFYLGQPGAGVLRLILSPLLIPGIIWEIIDLFRIDHEVEVLNLKLAEQLIAANTLDVHSPAVTAAVAHLNAMRQAQQQESSQAANAATAPAPAAPTTLEALVETPISGDPSTPATSTIEIRQETSEEAPPIWPVDPDVAALTAAAQAAAAGDTVEGAAQTITEPASALPADGMDITPAMVADAAAAADAEAPLAHGQAPAYFSADEPPAAAPPDAPSDAPPTLADDTTIIAAPVAALAAVAAVAADRHRQLDLTDSGPDTAELPILADPGEATGKRVVVKLPDTGAAMLPPTPDWTDMPPVPAGETGGEPSDAPESGHSMAVPLAEETATLLLLPIEPEVAPPAPAVPAANDAPETPPAVEAPAVAAAPQDGYQSDVSEEVHDRLTDTGSHRIVKRVKVVRRLVINGQVVEEAAAEQVVDADADTSTTARNLQESLRGGDIHQRIAALSAPITPPPAEAPAANDAGDAAAGSATSPAEG